MLKIGLRAANLPNDQETAILVTHIIQNYGGHTPSEIRLAFDMAIAGKLDVETNAYENFSCLYFSNIMNAYRTWAKQAVPHIKKDIALPEPPKQMTDSEMEDFIKSYKKGNTALELLPEFLYQWLIDKSRIWTKWDDMTIVNEAIAYRKYQILKALENNPGDRMIITERAQFKEMLNQGFFEGAELKRIESLSKKILVRDYLNAMK